MAGIDRINASEPVVGGLNNRRIENKDASETGGFALPEDKDDGGVIYEPSVKKEKPKTLAQTREEIAREERALAKQNLHSRFDGPGVEVELSTAAVEKAARAEKQESLGEIFRDFFAGIKAFFVSLWVGPDGDASKEKAVSTNTASIEDAISEGEAEGDNSAIEAVIPEEDGADFEEIVLGKDGETPKALHTDEYGAALEAIAIGKDVAPPTPDDTGLNRENSPESIAAFMSDYGGRRLAKNSDLLTQYDRNGRIVSPSASDRRRILQGEGNIRRY